MQVTIDDLYTQSLYINTNTFPKLNQVTANVGYGTHMSVDTHLHVLFCVQRQEKSVGEMFPLKFVILSFNSGSVCRLSL